MKNKNKFSIRTIVAIGIGAAVFMILGRFGSIPSGIPNTNIETAYAYLALMAILYGPAAGFLIGLIGHGLKDLVFYGMPWFSWVISSAIVGPTLAEDWKPNVSVSSSAASTGAPSFTTNPWRKRSWLTPDIL